VFRCLSLSAPLENITLFSSRDATYQKVHTNQRTQHYLKTKNYPNLLEKELAVKPATAFAHEGIPTCNSSSIDNLLATSATIGTCPIFLGKNLARLTVKLHFPYRICISGTI
jgi:hypothetical protein